MVSVLTLMGVFMSDINTKDKAIYDKLMTAVKNLNAPQTAEILYFYPFLTPYLEKSMPGLNLHVAAQNSVELIDIFNAFWPDCEHEKNTNASQDSGSFPLLPLNGSENFKESIAELKSTLIQKYNLETIYQLYILTGIQPTNCDRTLNKDGHKGPHLRFVLPFFDSLGKELSKEYIETKTLLKLFNIEFADGFGTNQHHFISILPNQYALINDIFNQQTLNPTSAIQTNILEDNEKLCLFNILFSLDYLRKLQKRNNDDYMLTGVMLTLANFNLNGSPCFNYLKEMGHVFKHEVFNTPEITISSPLLEKNETSRLLCFSEQAPTNIINKERERANSQPSFPVSTAEKTGEQKRKISNQF